MIYLLHFLLHHFFTHLILPVSSFFHFTKFVLPSPPPLNCLLHQSLPPPPQPPIFIVAAVSTNHPRWHSTTNEVYFSSGLVKFFLELCIPDMGFLSLYYNHYISFSLFHFLLHINSSVIFHSKLQVAKLRNCQNCLLLWG